MLDPNEQRNLAVDVTRKLRKAGYEAYWAGGCVRDQILGLRPADYDVATSARPDEIRKLFGKNRTLAIGAAFGVITVLGTKTSGQIEVATFREDAEYSDGRRPDAVHYSTAEEDANRRDFTINGMFYDPIEDKIIDFVGGQEDLKRGVIRAIGDPQERIEEDKLRMLRAVRFSATFEFELEEATADAVRQRAHDLTVVSAERVGAEMRRMLTHKNRAAAIKRLHDTGLLAIVLPEHAKLEAEESWDWTIDLLAALKEPSFSTALTALLFHHTDEKTLAKVTEGWRLSNKESERTAWLLEKATALDGASEQYWPDVQRILIHEGIADLVTLQAARVALHRAEEADLAFVQERLAWPAEKLNPPPLVTGDDLVRHGLQPGKAFRTLLEAARNAQLMGEIETQAAAFTLVDRLVENS